MAHTATADDLKRAVHHHPAHSGAGALERLFTFAFSGLVYPFYRYGLLGRFIGSAHLLARLHGQDPATALSASTYRRLMHKAPHAGARSLKAD